MVTQNKSVNKLTKVNMVFNTSYQEFMILPMGCCGEATMLMAVGETGVTMPGVLGVYMAQLD